MTQEKEIKHRHDSGICSFYEGSCSDPFFMMEFQPLLTLIFYQTLYAKKEKKDVMEFVTILQKKDVTMVGAALFLSLSNFMYVLTLSNLKRYNLYLGMAEM